MRNYLSTTALAVSLSVGAAASLPAYSANVLLDFSGNICGVAGNDACSNFSQFGQNYGDIAGQLDVSHRSTDLVGVTHENFLKYWVNNYSGLNDVARGGSGTGGSCSTRTASNGPTASLARSRLTPRRYRTRC